MHTRHLMIKPNRIKSSLEAHKILWPLFATDVEEFWAIALDPQKRILSYKMLFRGTVDGCSVHPRDLFRFACEQNASSLIISHNHPSLDPKPSTADLTLTRRLVEVGRLIEIPVLDHILIVGANYRSFADQGWVRFFP